MPELNPSWIMLNSLPIHKETVFLFEKKCVARIPQKLQALRMIVMNLFTSKSTILSNLNQIMLNYTNLFLV